MAGIHGGRITRTEQIRFRIDFDAEKSKRHRTAIEALIGHIRPDVNDRDTLRLDYTVTVGYFDDVNRQLDAMLELLEDDDLVLAGDLEEMLHGRSVIVDVLAKLDAMIDREVAL